MSFGRAIFVLVGLAIFACADTIAPIRLGASDCEVQADCPADSKCYRGVCLLRRYNCQINGILEPGEACDDGNQADDDGCTTDCLKTRCGDGIVRRGLALGQDGYEECDPAAPSGMAYCRADCLKTPKPSVLVATPRLTCLGLEDVNFCWGQGFDGVETGVVVRRAVPYRTQNIVVAGFSEVAQVDFTGILWGPHQPLAGTSSRTYHRWYYRHPQHLRAYRHGQWSRENPSLAQADEMNTCLVDREGRVGCLGDNQCGQLPGYEGEAPLRGNFALPHSIDVPPARDLAIARQTICSLGIDGRVHCWGDRADWGDPVGCDAQPPAAVEGLPPLVAITAETRSFAGLTTDGEVIRWGAVVDGRTGSGPVRRIVVGEALNLPGPARRVVSSEGSLCVILADSRVGCLGVINGPEHDGSFRLVEGLQGVVDLTDSTLARHVCALTETDQVWCWGDNEYGQLGDDTTVARYVPARVQWNR